MSKNKGGGSDEKNISNSYFNIFFNKAAWPRKHKTPVVYDMATASKAMGEVQVAARDGHKIPLGTGLNKNGEKNHLKKDRKDRIAEKIIRYILKKSMITV